MNSFAQVNDFIEKCKSEGATDEEIRQVLLQVFTAIFMKAMHEFEDKVTDAAKQQLIEQAKVVAESQSTEELAQKLETYLNFKIDDAGVTFSDLANKYVGEFFAQV